MCSHGESLSLLAGTLSEEEHQQLPHDFVRIDLESWTRVQAEIEPLLTPYTGELTTFSNDSLSVQYTRQPLIFEGRVLVKTIWSYTDDGEGQPRRTREAVEKIHACPHQPFRDSAWTAYQPGETWKLPDNELGLTTMEASRCRMGDERSGTCPLCRTDFTVEGSQMKATVRCWRDLGPEASPTHTDWKASHEPGSVRTLYEYAEIRQMSCSLSTGTVSDDSVEALDDCVPTSTVTMV